MMKKITQWTPCFVWFNWYQKTASYGHDPDIHQLLSPEMSLNRLFREAYKNYEKEPLLIYLLELFLWQL